MRRVTLRTHHGILLRNSYIGVHPWLEELKAGMSQSEPISRGTPGNSRGSIRRLFSRRRQGKSERHLRSKHQRQEPAPDDGRRKTFWENITSGSGLSIPHAGWGIPGLAHPVLFPSELLAAIELEHTDVFDPGEFLLPLKSPLRKKTRPQRVGALALAGTPSGRHCALAKAAKENVGEGASREWRQEEQQWLAEQEKRQLSELHLHIDGRCDHVKVSLSRSECTTIMR